MQTTQGIIFLPAVQRYVAEKIVGVLPPKTQGTLAPSNIPKIKPMSDTKIDLLAREIIND
ncbi:hypothetical protein [Gilliamella sp. WF3-4]|jgi:hypothetical protein|uniref:hypothetical protein n=1 Tax=Gilliamella sp. WF3-4 TaxID=3120255 RepID=UPI00080DED5D|nr:hypothetical protein [Gilliamella apicola]OCG17706.1 hypothetical protein A9G47_08040 [Gilliamella apicola]